MRRRAIGFTAAAAGLASLIAATLPTTAAGATFVVASHLFPVTESRLVNVNTYGPANYLTYTVANRSTTDISCTGHVFDADNDGYAKAQRVLTLGERSVRNPASIDETALAEFEALQADRLRDPALEDYITVKAGESRDYVVPGLTASTTPGDPVGRRSFSSLAIATVCQSARPYETPQTIGFNITLVEDSGHIDPIPPVDPTDPGEPTEPTDATDPTTDPTDPSGPVDPTNPTDPGTPTPGSSDLLGGLFS